MIMIAGLLMLAAALVALTDIVGSQVHNRSTTTVKTADQTGRRFIWDEVTLTIRSASAAQVAARSSAACRPDGVGRSRPCR